MKFGKDQKGQLYVAWHQANNGYKRAWIQHKEPGSEKDWAKVPDGRYLNVVRIEGLDKGPAGNATDFPVFSGQSDEQVLKSFVYAISAITGCNVEDVETVA